MKKAKALLAICAALVATVCLAEVTADVGFRIEDMDNGSQRLHADFRMHGIEAGEVFQYEFRWTAPDVFYVHKDGKKTRLFKDSVYAPKKPAGDTSQDRVPCYCADTKEAGCWRTTAYRTITTTLANGKQYRAAGEWKVQLVRLDTDKVIKEGTFVVE